MKIIWLTQNYAPISENYSRDQYFCFCVFAVIEEVQDYGQSKNNLETEEQHGAHAKSLTVVHYNNFDITVFYQKNFCTLMLIFLYEESKVEFYIPNDCFTNVFHPILITNKICFNSSCVFVLWWGIYNGCECGQFWGDWKNWNVKLIISLKHFTERSTSVCSLTAELCSGRLLGKNMATIVIRKCCSMANISWQILC